MEYLDLTQKEVYEAFDSSYDKYYLLINKKNYRELGKKHYISGVSVDPTPLIHKMRVNGLEEYQLVAPYRKVKGDIQMSPFLN